MSDKEREKSCVELCDQWCEQAGLETYSDLSARLAAAEARCDRLRDDVHTAWSAERAVRERLEAFESFVRRIAEYPMKRSDELGVVSIRAEAKEMLSDVEESR